MDHTDPRYRWYTKDQAAHEADISVRTLNRWISSGLLTPRFGRVNADALFDVEASQRARRHRGRPGARLSI